MIKVYEDTIIYVACPAKTETGGPELLHQLVYKLNYLGYDSRMYYYGRKYGKPIAKSYKRYNKTYVKNMEDKKHNILIVPEVKTSLLYEYSNIRKVVWWLSVDNYFNVINNQSKIKIFIKNFLGKKYYKFEDKDILNIAQSYYAIDFLNNQNIKEVQYLSDYLNENFLGKFKSVKFSNKENLVLYNPRKGYEFTKKIIDKSPQFNWVPIENMTSIQVVEILSRAKVYIDFGNHPGKDRIPREAVICGCCIITGIRGSAKFYEDVPIDEEFKLKDEEKNIDLIINKIKICLENYVNEYKKFEKYKQNIIDEEVAFERSIQTIFNKEYKI